MTRYKAVVLLICVCLIAFKTVSTARFVESGLLRAQVYASYEDPLSYIAGDVQHPDSTPQKIDPSMMVSFHFPGMIFLLALTFASPLLRNYLRPTVSRMSGRDFQRRIYKPPKQSIC